MKLEVTNPGDVASNGFSLAGNGTLRARFRSLAGSDWALEVREPADGSWRDLVRGSYGDYLSLLSYISNSPHAWAISNLNRDRAALVRLDLRSGTEEVVYENAVADVAGASITRNGRLRFAVTWPGFQELKFFDAELQADLAPFLARPRTALRLESLDRRDRWMTFALESDSGERDVFLLDRKTKDATRLARSAMHPHVEHLAAMEPISFTARDGMMIHGLLTRPLGADGPRPMVLLVHGGPWMNDRWRYSSTVQFLANRGYAVLQVNYRGSTNFGRAYLMAGTREIGRRMHDDLVDGVRWAIAQGIANPSRVAIMGASFGGYAALSGLAFTPEIFAAGIDQVGVADLAAFIEDAPRYWNAARPYMDKFFGNVNDPRDRKELAERSPINHVDAIRAPLLVAQGANDVRVKRDHSDRIVDALRARHHDVEYLVFPDEGHGINSTRNMLAYMRAVERFLARTIGGRDPGEDAE